jgi:lysine-N-methylase
MDNSMKMDFYDQFHCIADQCPFTCCQGWEIAVDTDTFRKWQDIDGGTDYILKNVKQKKTGKGYQNLIRLNARKKCPFMDKNGLCNIVLEHGEDYLSVTCRLYPRQINRNDNISEYSLSCSCPAVVDLLNRKGEKVHFICSDETNHRENDQIEYIIRDVMISIIQKDTLSLRDRILLIFYMLLAVKNEQNSKINITIEIINSFNNPTYLQSVIDIWRNVETPQVDSIQEVNELFLDINLNYRKVESFKKHLQDITSLSETLGENVDMEDWNSFLISYSRYDYLFENELVTGIFADCISGGIDGMLFSFQILVTEYLMTRHAVFLKDRIYSNNGNITYSDVRDYTSVYTRIIGYNQVGIKEFWEESFDEAVWEFGYMLLLLG